MNIVSCSRCGSNELDIIGGYRVCRYCGTKYQITKDDFGVKNSDISLDNDVQRLIEKCRQEPKNAKKYANLILDIDPSNKEALKYLK